MKNPILLLVCATPLEARAILAGFPDAAGLVASLDLRPGDSLDLELAGRRVRLAISGVGPISAGIATGQAIGELRAVGEIASGVLNLGIAGVFAAAGLPLGAVVAAGGEVCPEFGLLTADGLRADGLKFAQGEIRGESVYDRIGLDPMGAAARMGLRLSAKWPVRDFLSVGMVSGWPGRAAEMSRRYDCALENMEGFAVALASARSEVPFLEVRCVSNLVGCRPPDGWDLRLALRQLGGILPDLLVNIEV